MYDFKSAMSGHIDVTSLNFYCYSPTPEERKFYRRIARRQLKADLYSMLIDEISPLDEPQATLVPDTSTSPVLDEKTTVIPCTFNKET